MIWISIIQPASLSSNRTGHEKRRVKKGKGKKKEREREKKREEERKRESRKCLYIDGYLGI